ncbi:MAG: hypothetical protein ACT4O2_10365 [Beijerinckiaceae bacterium]
MSLTRINRTGEPQVIPASDDRADHLGPLQIKRREVVTLSVTRRGPRDPGAASQHHCNWPWPMDTAGSPCSSPAW